MTLSLRNAFLMSLSVASLLTPRTGGRERCDCQRVKSVLARATARLCAKRRQGLSRGATAPSYRSASFLKTALADAVGAHITSSAAASTLAAAAAAKKEARIWLPSRAWS